MIRRRRMEKKKESIANYFKTDASGKRYAKLKSKNRVRWILWDDETKMRPELIDALLADTLDFVFTRIDDKRPEDYQKERFVEYWDDIRHYEVDPISWTG
jgi:hypothetical protein